MCACVQSQLAFERTSFVECRIPFLKVDKIQFCFLTPGGTANLEITPLFGRSKDCVIVEIGCGGFDHYGSFCVLGYS